MDASRRNLSLFQKFCLVLLPKLVLLDSFCIAHSNVIMNYTNKSRNEGASRLALQV